MKLPPETLSFAKALPNGVLVVGALGKLGIVQPSGNAAWWPVPCVPRDATEVSASGALLVACDHPASALRLDSSGLVSFARAEVSFDGEPDSENSRFTWAGSVAGQPFAVFVSGSGESRTIALGEDSWRTAAPWRGKGCDVLVTGMAIGLAGGRLTGATIGSEDGPL